MTGNIWRIYAPLDQIAGLDLEADAINHINDFFDRGEGGGMQVSMIAANAQLPDVVELEQRGGKIGDPIKGRLLTTRCIIELENPGKLHASPLQVSLLDFLLRRAGPCIIQWDDNNFQFGEEALEETRQYPNIGSLEGATAMEPSQPTTSAESTHGDELSPLQRLASALTGEDLDDDDFSEDEDAMSGADGPREQQRPLNPIERFLDILEAAQADMDRTADVGRAISRLPPMANQFLRLVASQGMMPLAVAATQLKTTEKAVNGAVQEIEDMFRRLDLWD